MRVEVAGEPGLREQSCGGGGPQREGVGKGSVDGGAFGPQAGAGTRHGVLGESVGDVVAEGDEPVDRGDRLVRVACGELWPGGEPVLDDGDGDGLLAGVVEVDGAAGPARSGAHVVDAGGRVSLFGEELGSRFQQ